MKKQLTLISPYQSGTTQELQSFIDSSDRLKMVENPLRIRKKLQILSVKFRLWSSVILVFYCFFLRTYNKPTHFQ